MEKAFSCRQLYPILVAKDGDIIDGNQRTELAEAINQKLHRLVSHDVAAIEVTNSKEGFTPMPTVGQGQNVTIQVTVEN